MGHVFEGWVESPEGATHFSVANVCSPWLKVVGDKVFYHSHGQWHPYPEKLTSDRHLAGAHVRPAEKKTLC